MGVGQGGTSPAVTVIDGSTSASHCGSTSPKGVIADAAPAFESSPADGVSAEDDRGEPPGEAEVHAMAHAARTAPEYATNKGRMARPQFSTSTVTVSVAVLPC